MKLAIISLIGVLLMILVFVLMLSGKTNGKTRGKTRGKSEDKTSGDQDKKKDTNDTNDTNDTSYKTFSCSVSILTPEESIQVLQNNQNFWKDLDHEEWTKRSVTTLEDYLQTVRNDFILPTRHQYEILCTACQQADRFFSTHPIENFHGEIAAKIPWKIGVFQGTQYEFGWPHTMSDVIFVPITAIEDDKLVKLLVHEKVHLYQRLFHNLTQKYLSELGFVKWRRRTAADKHIRPNPDLDGWIYKQHNHPYGMELMHQVPTPDTNPQFYEHPFERMAIEISRMLC